MNLMINNSSMQPIYEQIMEQIKQLVLTGKLKEESPLPSVRSLSKDLKISALTVKKAYDKLEEEGFIAFKTDNEGLFDFTLEEWMQAIEDSVPAKFLELNKKAFALGRGALA